MQECRFFGVQECRFFGVQEFRSSGVLPRQARSFGKAVQTLLPTLKRYQLQYICLNSKYK